MEQAIEVDIIETFEQADVSAAETIVDANEEANAPPLEALRIDDTPRVACQIGAISCADCMKAAGCPLFSLRNTIEQTPPTEQSPREQLFDESVDFVQPIQPIAPPKQTPAPEIPQFVQTTSTPITVAVTQIPATPIRKPTIETLQTDAIAIAEPQLSPVGVIEAIHQTVAATPELDTPSFQPSSSTEITSEAPDTSDTYSGAASTPTETSNTSLVEINTSEEEVHQTIDVVDYPDIVIELSADNSPALDIRIEDAPAQFSEPAPPKDLVEFGIGQPEVEQSDIEPTIDTMSIIYEILSDTIEAEEVIDEIEPTSDDAFFDAPEQPHIETTDIELRHEPSANELCIETQLAPAQESLQATVVDDATKVESENILVDEDEAACPYRWAEEGEEERESDDDEEAENTNVAPDEAISIDLPESQFAAYIEREQIVDDDIIEAPLEEDFYSVEDLGDPEDIDDATLSIISANDMTAKRLLGRIAYTLAA